MNITATRPIPADYRKAANMAQGVSLEAGMLYNSIIDGTPEQISVAQIHDLFLQIGKFTKRRSKFTIDASTTVILHDAIDEILSAENAYRLGGYAQAAEHLEAAATHLETVEGHVIGLFSPRS